VLLARDLSLRSLPRGHQTFPLMEKYAKDQERTMLPRSQPPHGPPFFHPNALRAIIGIDLGTGIVLG